MVPPRPRTPALAITTSMRPNRSRVRRNGFLDRREVGDVALQRQTMARREGRGNGLRRRQVDIGDHHPCPALSQVQWRWLHPARDRPR